MLTKQINVIVEVRRFPWSAFTASIQVEANSSCSLEFDIRCSYCILVLQRMAPHLYMGVLGYKRT